MLGEIICATRRFLPACDDFLHITRTSSVKMFALSLNHRVDSRSPAAFACRSPSTPCRGATRCAAAEREEVVPLIVGVRVDFQEPERCTEIKGDRCIRCRHIGMCDAVRDVATSVYPDCGINGNPRCIGLHPTLRKRRMPVAEGQELHVNFRINLNP